MTDPIPANTTFTSAGDGGTFSSGAVHWTGLTIAAQAQVDLHFTVTISPTLASSVTSIVNDGIVVTSTQGVGATGSAHSTPIAPPYAVSLSPTSQTDGAHVGTSATYQFKITNLGFNDDTYTLGATFGTFTATVLNAACTSAQTSITIASGASANVCLKVDVPSGAANASTDTATLTATSTGDPTVHASATATTIAVAVDVLLVDNDHHGNPPLPDVRSYYTTALTSAGQTFDVWDLQTSPDLPLGYMKAHKSIVWFTGASYPNPVGVYETNLAAFLDAGGRLFMSGQDILDQGAGTTAFFHDYVHIDWDGSETQNDKATAHVTGVAANPVTGSFGTVPLDLSVLLGAQFSDQVTPIAPAVPAFTDDNTKTDALTVTAGAYKVVFLAFPFEEFGTAAQKTSLMTSVFSYFNAP